MRRRRRLKDGTRRLLLPHGTDDARVMAVNKLRERDANLDRRIIGEGSES